MSEEQKDLHEQSDERYTQICAHVRSVGEEMRESMFAAVEAGDLDSACSYVDTLRELDFIFTLSLKCGMAINDAKKEAWKKTPEGQAAMKAEEDRQQAEIDAALANRDRLKKAQTDIGMTDPQTKQEAPPTT